MIILLRKFFNSILHCIRTFVLFSIIIFVFLTHVGRLQAQALQSPDEYLGYSPAVGFATSFEALSYLQYLVSHTDKCMLQKYGQTPEGRSLNVFYISSAHNIKNIEEIRLNHLQYIHFANGIPEKAEKIILWNSFNVHGNEPAGLETAMYFAYELLRENSEYAHILDSVVVILDPCLNPDGRDAYVHYQRRLKGEFPVADANDMEHLRIWPGERYNHYIFDLNRDWLWATQNETQDRLKIFNSWMPHIHADFHEMNNLYSYFFVPVAKPVHPLVTDWQNEFQMHINRANSRVFNANGWQYFSREIYDLFYPGFGDSYPTFRGSMGLTFEKGGIDAGLVLRRENKDSITFTGRVQEHMVSAVNTLITAYSFREQLVRNQINYFDFSKKSNHKWYLIKTNGNVFIQKNIAKLLETHNLKFQVIQNQKQLTGWKYSSQKTGILTLQPGDFYISTLQPDGVLCRILFEPSFELEDSLTYDLTAWSLPYALAADGLILNAEPNGLKLEKYVEKTFITNKVSESALAVVLPWQNIYDAKTIFQLLGQNIVLRRISKTLSFGGMEFQSGTFVCLLSENTLKTKDIHIYLENVCKKNGTNLFVIDSSNVLYGVELGSNELIPVRKPSVALLGGAGIAPTSYADLWFSFEHFFNFPVTRLRTDLLENVNLGQYDYLVVPSGDIPESISDILKRYVRNGGNLILIENAMAEFLNRGYDGMTIEQWNLDSLSQQIAYNMKKRMSLTTKAMGAIFEVNPDLTNPLFWGVHKLYVLKRNNLIINVNHSVHTAVKLTKNGYKAGYMGHEFERNVHKQIQYLVTETEGGKIIYFADSPLFRAFWLADGLVFANALFL